MLSKLTLFSIVLICLSCDPNEIETIEIPQDLELDLNQDGISDFNLVYFQTIAGDPIGNYKQIILKIESIEGDQILKHEDGLPIFLIDIDSIQSQVTSPLFWEIPNPSSNTQPLASISTKYDEVTWNKKWSIYSKIEKETYIIGFKLLKNTSSQIGFFEFSIDNYTGQFTLLKTEFL